MLEINFFLIRNGRQINVFVGGHQIFIINRKLGHLRISQFNTVILQCPSKFFRCHKSSFVKQEDVSHTPLLYPKKAVVSSNPTIYSGFLDAVAPAR